MHLTVMRGFIHFVDIRLEIDPGESALIKNYYSNVEHTLPYYYLNDNICINVDKSISESDIKINPGIVFKTGGRKSRSN
jgi:hypothetical protein